MSEETKSEATTAAPKKEKKPKLSQKERLEHAAKLHETNMKKAEEKKKELEKKEAEKNKVGAERAEKVAAALKAKEEAKAAKEKAKAEAKEAKAAGKAPAGPRAFGASPNKGKEIVVLTEGGKNPRREGTNGFNSFALLVPGMIYEEYIKAGGRSVDLAYDIDHGFVKVVEVPAVESAAE